MTKNKKINPFVAASKVGSAVFFLSALNSFAIGYSEPVSYKSPKAKITVDPSKHDDTASIRNAINTVSARGGGTIWMPAGNYRCSGVSLKSNVHIKISKNARLLPTTSSAIFSFSGGVTNSSVRGIGGSPEVTMPNAEKSRFVMITSAKNVLVSNFKIKDPKESIFSSVELTWDSKRNEIPKGVTLKNIKQIGASYGYGITQVQAAENTLFSNLNCDGGVTLRLETGWKAMNLANEGGVRDIKGTNIVSKNGQAAVKLQPHARRNGDVFLNYVTANKSLNAISFEKGGTWKYSAEQIKNLPWIREGSFGNLAMGNVHAIYGSGGIDVTWSKLNHYTSNELNKAVRSNSNETGYKGPSISTIGNTGKARKLTTWKVSKAGAFKHPAITNNSHIKSFPGSRKKGLPLE